MSAAGAERDDELRALLDSNLDASLLLNLALHERAAYPVWRRLSGLGLAEWHADVDDALRRYAMIAGFRQQALENRMRSALDTLGSAGYQPMLLKGAALAVTVYDSFADRPMGDVDLLLPASAARPSYDLLLDNGWHSDCTPERERFYDGHHHLPRLHADEHETAILELHRSIFPAWSPFRLGIDEFWGDSRTISVGRFDVHVPSIEHALLHLCTHFSWSHLARKRAWLTFRDLHAILDRETVDWASFCRTARRARAASCCYWTLRLAASLSGLRVPNDVLEELQPPGRAILLQCIETHFSGELLPSNRACPSARVQRAMWELAIRPSWSGHGAARPWQQAFNAPDEQPHTTAGGTQSRPRSPGAWRRYFGALVLASR